MRATMQSTHALEVALGAGNKSFANIKGVAGYGYVHVSRHLSPFHPAYMHKKWCHKIDAKREWHAPPQLKLHQSDRPVRITRC